MQNVLELKTQIKPNNEKPPSYVQNSPRWLRLNKMERRNTDVANDFIKFSDYLVKIKNIIDHTKNEMDKDHAFNQYDYSHRSRKTKSLMKTFSPDKTAKQE